MAAPARGGRLSPQAKESGDVDESHCRACLRVDESRLGHSNGLIETLIRAPSTTASADTVAFIPLGLSRVDRRSYIILGAACLVDVTMMPKRLFLPSGLPKGHSV